MHIEKSLGLYHRYTLTFGNLKNSGFNENKWASRDDFALATVAPFCPDGTIIANDTLKTKTKSVHKPSKIFVLVVQCGSLGDL